MRIRSGLRPSGETGRRTGLKIPWSTRSVRVRSPPRPLRKPVGVVPEVFSLYLSWSWPPFFRRPIWLMPCLTCLNGVLRRSRCCCPGWRRHSFACCRSVAVPSPIRCGREPPRSLALSQLIHHWSPSCCRGESHLRLILRLTAAWHRFLGRPDGRRGTAAGHRPPVPASVCPTG